MRIFIIFLSVTIGSLGCAHSKKISLNSELILGWSEAKKNPETAPREVLYRYKKGGKTLLYLAAGHGTSKKSKTFKSISYVFKNEKVDVSIVEGFQRSFGLSPESILIPMAKGINGDFYPGGVSSFLVISSDKNDVPFIGAEPDPKDVMESLLKKEFTTTDYLSFLFIRALPQRVRSGELEKKGLKKVFDKYMSWKKREFSLPSVITLDQFKDWYREKQGKVFTIEGIEPGETAPLENGKLLTHKISILASRIRDESIVETIEEMLNKNDTVFIAYGSSHFRIQHLALSEGLGNPEIITVE